MAKVLVLYYSSYGPIERMAEEGARYQGKHIAQIAAKLHDQAPKGKP